MGGEVKKKKKKGRPSLLDIQKRSLKQQQQQQNQNQNQKPNFKNPNSLNLTTHSHSHSRRSNTRNPNSDDENDDDDERKQKKHKLLLGLNSHNHFHSSSKPNSISDGFSPNADGENSGSSLKRRKIIAAGHRSDQTEENGLKVTDSLHGSPMESGPTTTPLPDIKLLFFILDRLQKKDSYGVFSEPADTEELPDYLDVVEHPMDFSTVRRKLEDGNYSCLEEFENDVLLIGSNGMLYNASDTIFYKQARSIQEIAKKSFENLRQESDDDDDEGEPQPKVTPRRGRPPGSHNIKKLLAASSGKKLVETSSGERVTSRLSSDAILASGGGQSTTGLSNAYNLRRGPSSYRFHPTDTPSHGNWAADWENEFPASVVKAVMKYGKKYSQVDENRRDTYYQQLLTSAQEPSVLSTLEHEVKNLIPVGLHSEFGYARSLARFAADLSPVAWNIASQKIKNVLPKGVKFGRGWVGENVTTEPQHILPPEKQKYSNNSLSDDHSAKIISPTTSISNTFIGNREDADSSRRFNRDGGELNGINNSSLIQPRPGISFDRNSFNYGQGFNHPHQLELMRQGTPTQPVKSLSLGFGIGSSEVNLTEGSSRQYSENINAINDGQASRPNQRHEVQSFPPDLNVGFVPGSPSSNLQIGSPQQPDLALQL